MATGQSSYSSTSGTTYYDLTTANGDRAEINNALFFQNKPDDSSGTGLIQAIVRVQDPGGGDGEENGYNTSFRPLSYEENTSPQFTTSLLLNSVPIVTIDGAQYYEFRLDINQLNSSSLLSLDAIKIYTSDASDGQAQGLITGSWFTDNATLRYDLDAGGNSSILLDAGLSSGSGSSDMFFYVPVSNFGAVDPDVTYVTLYSEFGDAGVLDAGDGLSPLDDPANTALEDDGVDTGDTAAAVFGTYTANDGFEEWSVSKQTGGVISGYKFADLNGNGLWDDGETGLAGWTIDYTISYVSGKGNNQQTITLTGSAVTSDGTTDVDGDGDIDPAGFYTIFVPASTDKKETYTVTLTEDAQADFVNTYDGDALANYTTTFTFSGEDLTLGGSPNISGQFETTETMNFGNFELFDISGTKYTDVTGNGLTGDDTVLGGVTIFIDVNGNNADDDGYSTITAGDGTYSFTDLDYTVIGAEVKEITPTGYVQTVGQVGEVTDTEYLITGVDQEDLDFANFELFDISGTKYTDVTGDGLTGDDTVLGGVTIFIDVNGNNADDDGYSTVTAGDGTYSFTDLDYTVAGAEVKEITPTGYVQTVGQIGAVTDTSLDYVITGTSGEDQDDFDFANFELFDISGTKYTDVTGDGLTGDDTVLGGVTIFIDVNGNNLDDDGYSTVTAGDGTYSFTDLNYTVAGAEVKEITPSGYVQTVGQIGTVTDTSLDYVITGTSGEDQDDFDFANFELFDISGTKYTDVTGNGLSGDDTGLGGVTVFIDVNGNNADDDGYSTTTAGDGTYSFTNLDYSVIGAEVKEITPTGYVQTVGQVGDVTDTEYLITGVDQEDLDFANFELFDISGTKYTDVTGDGISADDTGLGGVTIFIDVNGNNLDDDGYSTITAGDGTYSFTDLDYTVAGAEVKEITPTGYVQTVGQIGAVTDTNYVITGTSGEDQDDFDFANFLPDPSIDIEKYVKTDVSGVFVDADDPNGPLASTSTTVDFKVVVSNDGNEALSGITLTDTIDHNGAETNEVIDYNLINAQIDIDNDSVIDGFWSDYDEDQDGTLDDADGDFTTVDDFILAPGASFAVYYSLDSALGQHENTASVEAVSAISDTTVSDEDDANYYVVESEDCVGVRTPGFWQNSKWGLFWNLNANSPGQTATDQDALPQAGEPNFPGGELLYAIDTNEDGFVNAIAGDGINDAEPLDTNASGLLIGDYNKNGITDLGLDGIANTGDAGEEDTLFISLADAKALINSSNKNLEGKAADGIFMLGRDVVATWLNYLANNPEGTTGECIGDVSGATNTPREYLDAAIDWLQQFASTTNGNPNQSWHDGNEQEKFSFDPKINPSSAVWQNPFTVGEDIPVSAAAMHSALDGYNNTGMINGVEYCCDADSPLVLNVLSQII